MKEKSDICGELIHWKQMPGGMLVLEEGMYTGRCPASGRTVRQRKRPKPGTSCGLPKWACRGAQKGGGQ